MTHNDIISKIRSGGQNELGLVYAEYREEFLRWITKEYHCSDDDSKDIYQLTILIFYDNIKQGKLENLVSSVKTYLFGIGKNVVRDVLRKEKRYTPINQEKWLKEYLVEDQAHAPDERAFDIAGIALGKLGQPCQRLIEMFYYEKKSMVEISEALQFKNPETAKNQKCKCMARLRKLFEEERSRTQNTINHVY
ncbi:RNA polymerase sigma factor, sigma-70 family [Chryseolinea serpens]|uniref:RNA polymerase sigma factor, sigma-70 family n=1 Tax=Chryseolinea serpens TaxID=947013 RepID=A0A1M5P1T9_9BACT|nr:sigma-70 family RNA polymerase sigma factor [Chryseolinea serpens]SHG95804.1 RNA polymerase sigma factor, sigma-70 family [Chryseolinea serpens]